MDDIYTNGVFLEATGATWHSEHSAWKASKILDIIERNTLRPKSIAEVGCGAGRVLAELANRPYLSGSRFEGYDISPEAIHLCESIPGDRCCFHCRDIFAGTEENTHAFDLLLAIDVFEHIPDYLGFLENCKARATYKIYHIPLDIHVSSVIRRSFVRDRYTIGHLHYFTAESALAALKDTGHEIVDQFYTDGALGVFRQNPRLKTAIANIPRWLVSRVSVPLSARLFGGYSLLVLAR